MSLASSPSPRLSYQLDSWFLNSIMICTGFLTSILNNFNPDESESDIGTGLNSYTDIAVFDHLVKNIYSVFRH